MKAGKTPSVMNYYSDMETPISEDMAIQLEELKNQGTFTPEQIELFLQDPSAFNDIEMNPEYEKMQMDAINKIAEKASAGGLSKSDRARLNQMKTDEDTANRGRRDSIIQNANARGMGGSGLELAAQLQNQQDSAMRSSQRDMDIAALADKQALEAVIQQGNMASQMQNNQFNRGAQTAQANDAISRFNAQNRQDQNMTNVTNRNTANETALLNKQNLANANVGLRNQSQIQNKGLEQQQFDNRMNILAGKQGVGNTNAQIAGQNSAAQANAMNQNLAMAAGAVSGGAGYMAANKAAQQQAKENQLNRENEYNIAQMRYRNGG